MPFSTRLTPALLARFRRSGHWGTETFHDILARRAAAHPDREAVVDHRHRVTYRELLERVDRTAAGLQRLGLGPGDVVTIQLPNWVEFAYVFFACERIGAVANQIGPDFRSREVEYIARFSESRAFVCPATFKGFDYVDMVRQLRPSLPDVDAVLVLGGGGDGMVSLDEIIDGSGAVALKSHRMDANEVMRMAFTSGTTGNPKGVTHSFNTTLPACTILNTAMNVTEREVFLVYLPLGLNWGYLTLVQSVMAGARAVLLDRFSARAALELIERERVTFIPSAPASLIAMLNDPELARFDLSSLRVVITGGASCPVETIRAFRKRIPGHLIELYGCSRPASTPSRASRTIPRRWPAPSAARRRAWGSASSTSTCGRCRWAPRARSPPTGRRCTSGITRTRPPTPSSSPPTAGSAPATSASWSPPATCASWVASRR
jgi:non-ribosomal peptide synthetase component E (peptide arylation enzyme)